MPGNEINLESIGIKIMKISFHCQERLMRLNVGQGIPGDHQIWERNIIALLMKVLNFVI